MKTRISIALSILLLSGVYFISGKAAARKTADFRDAPKEASSALAALNKGSAFQLKPAQKVGAGKTVLPRTPYKEWTVMCFFNGINSLEPPILQELKNLELTGSNDLVNVVAQVGRPRQRSEIGKHPQVKAWAGDWGGARRYYVMHEPDEKHITSPYEILPDAASDMGDYRNIVDFAKWTAEKFPAKHYMVVIFNHGAGWSYGFGSDDETNNSTRASQLGPAFEGISGAFGRKVDVAVFYACLMQSAEIAYEVRRYADFFVGSEEIAWAADMTFKLKSVVRSIASDPAIKPEQVARLFVERSQTYKWRTISMLRLSQMDAFVGKLTKWAGEVVRGAEASPKVKNAVIKAKKEVIRFGKHGFGEAAHEINSYGDLYHFASIVMENSKGRPALEKASIELLDHIISRLVVLANMDGKSETGGYYRQARGIAIELPLSGEQSFEQRRQIEQSYTTQYGELSLAKDTAWQQFVQWAQNLK